MKAIVPAIAALLIAAAPAHATMTQYALNRAVQFDGWANVEVEPWLVDGHAIIHDDGAYSPISRIIVDARICEDVHFSPPPACRPASVTIDADALGYSLDGGVYYLSNGLEVTVLRRGSDATGDPSLMLFIEGTVLIFSEWRGSES